MTLSIDRIDLSIAAGRDALSRIDRSALPDPDVVAGASSIVADVAARGDRAIREYADAFGGGLASNSIRVAPSAISEATAGIAPEVEQALRSSIESVRAVHSRQRPVNDVAEPVPGVVVERLWEPLDSVGVYVPGGRALYPSSLIMGVVPAQIAGVASIAVATPATPTGEVDGLVLATAGMLGVDVVYAMGGAQAVAALAHGTESVQRVAKIVGPGGPWVTAAKLSVYGVCGVDLPAGPSEAAIVVDDTADPVIVAADVMCQAEHGEESSIALITTSHAIADAILAEVDRTLPSLERADTIRAALSRFGLVVIAPDVGEAARTADRWAPEHLSIHTADARAVADAIRNAGSVFVGHWTPESAGDYATGANHVLPTGGLARAYGPLAVEDFGSWRQVQTLTEDGLQHLAPTIITLARAEGLTAHAHAVSVRSGSS